MEVRSGGDGLSVCLEDILLLFEECEVAAYVIEDLSLFELGTLAHALPVHNEYIIISISGGYIQMRAIIINADDYGCKDSIDRGIVRLMRKGRINSTSVIVNGENIEHAARIVREMREEVAGFERGVSVGLHFNLTEGKPLTK